MRRRIRRRLRIVSHAGAHIHGRRSAARSRFPRSAPGPVGEARHSQRLQRLPHRQIGAMGGSAAVESWFGPNRKGFQNYAEAFHAPWTDKPDAAALLAAVAADPTRAGIRPRERVDRTCAERVVRRTSPGASRPCGSRSDGADRCPRHAGKRYRPTRFGRLLRRCCPIPCRGVRIRAVSLLAAVPAADQPPADRERFERAAAEFIAAQRLNDDRPEARSTLGNFFAQRGRPPKRRPNTRLRCG